MQPVSPKPPARLDDERIRRYGRQILLDAVGGRGQRALLCGVVAIELGGDDRGKGSDSGADSDEDVASALVALAYLAGAGVGELVLRSSGERWGAQVTRAQLGLLLGAEELGQPLGEAIVRQVAARNPDVRVRWGGAERERGEREELGEIVELVLPAASLLEPLIGDAAVATASLRAARAQWRGSAAATAALAALLAGAR